MKTKEKIINLMKKNNGYLTTKELSKNNISRNYIKKLIEDNVISKLDRGIYINSLEVIDQYYFYELKYKDIVFSGNSAMYLQNMNDTLYHKIEANFKHDYNTSKVNKDIKTHRLVEWKLNLGKEKVKTLFGNYVTTYNKERIICDLVENIDDYDLETRHTTFKTFKNSNPNYERLFDYGKKWVLQRKSKTV